MDRPLDVALHLQPGDARQMEMPLTCLQVEVRYGDFVVPPGQLHVASTGVPGAQQIRLSVSSPLLVNEPLVHLRLVITCEPQLERRWTLFADPPRLAAQGPARNMPEDRWLDSAAGLAALAPPADAAEPMPVAETPLPPPPAARKRRATARARNRPEGDPPARAHLAAPPPSHPTARARLSLAPGDAEWLVQAVWSEIQRQQATRVATPPETMRGELHQLRLENDQLRAATAALQQRLDRLVEQKPPPAAALQWAASAGWAARQVAPWMAGLLAAALLAWGLYRFTPRTDESLAGIDLDPHSNGSSSGLALRPPEAAPSAPSAPANPPRTRRGGPAAAFAGPAAERARQPASSAWSSPQAPDVPPPRAAELPPACIEHTMPPGMRAQVEEMVRAGDLAAALILLEFHLDQQPHKSAPTLMALLDIYRALGQQVPAQGVHDQLSSLFNVRAASEPDDGTGLEAHPATLRSLTTQWSGPHVREVLKNLMLRPAALEELQLSAFRDVLALYELAGLRDGEATPQTAASAAVAW